MISAEAEMLNVKIGKIRYQIPVSKAGDMVFGSDGSLMVMGKEYNLESVSSMDVEDGEVVSNTVKITYEGDNASVDIDGSIASYIDVAVEKADVRIVQSDLVSETTCGEIQYILVGSSESGSFNLTGSYKSTIELAGLSLTNPSGAAIDIQNGKRIKLNIADGTVNNLKDCENGSQKGALVCKGHLEIKGAGTLNVSGLTSHAVYSKEYIELKKANINITGAKKDGINCNQYFLMESGALSVTGTGDDGIQVSFKDDTDREAEDTGSIMIKGGTLNITVTATAAKAIKADGDITVSGGNILASVSGGAKWDATDVKTKAASCLSADGNMNISGGTLDLTATGCAGKGISVDGDLLIGGVELTVSTSGGMAVYRNNQLTENYTGNTDNINSDLKSSPKGIKADGNITIDGGSINVTTRANGGEGIESKKILSVNDGIINIKAYDDGLNSKSHTYLNGGDITVVATNNDAIDANGNLYVTGGNIRAFGPGSPEGGIDANDEEGYKVYFTGGTLLAYGGRHSLPSNSASTQAYISSSVSVKAGDSVILKSGDNVLCSFVVPENYTSSSSSTGGDGRPGGGGPGGMGTSGGTLVITCPDLVTGSSYTLAAGSSTSTVKAVAYGSSSRPW